jgi:hypothetical protein
MDAIKLSITYAKLKSTWLTACPLARKEPLS